MYRALIDELGDAMAELEAALDAVDYLVELVPQVPLDLSDTVEEVATAGMATLEAWINNCFGIPWCPWD